MLLNKIIDFFTSLRLTVACLSCALVLVFAGTLAQVNLGLYEAQDRYFQSFFVFWGPQGSNWRIPVWPGGYLLGWVLLINLVAAHIKRFSLTRKKAGIFLIHIGLILLLLGQFLTEVFQVESNMRLEEGQTRNYTESTFHNELAIVNVSKPDVDEVVSIPESRLVQNSEIKHPNLPFTLRVKHFAPNSVPSLRAGTGTGEPASAGVGRKLFFLPEPLTAKMDERNLPSAQIEIVTPQGDGGTWAVSSWLAISPLTDAIQRQFGSQLGDLLQTPQQFKVGDQTFHLELRPTRYYKPFNLTLLDFTHDRYKGTEIPKNFSSHVRLRNPATGEDREVLIYMNNPLRYAGETYYQGSFEPGDTTSILHVVRNPAWLTPYLSCSLVGLGLLVQFTMHLLAFSKRGPRSAAPGSARPRPERAKPAETPDAELIQRSIAGGTTPARRKA